MEGLEKLKDIKPPVEVSDISFIIFLIALFFVFFIVGTISYFVFKKYLKRRRKKRKNEKERALENLKKIDFKDTKKAVYSFSENGYIAAKNDPEKLEKLKIILKDLEKYKYKKETPQLSKEDIKKMKEFIKAIK